MEFEQWSDEQILSTCVRYGEEARTWRNKFLGLLPEVERRKLYLQKGFSSVMHFAQAIGGVSEEQVRTALRLDKKLEATPLLHHLFTNGEVSAGKMDRIASIAEPENEEFLVNQVQFLSQRSLDTLVRDIKNTEEKSLCAQRSTLPTISENVQVAVPLQEEVANELLTLREKGIDIDTLIRDALVQRKVRIEEEKETIGKNCSETNSRYIPKSVRSILEKEYGAKCSITDCTKPAEEIHHTQRFSLAQKHDPRYMAPFCKEHHQIAHSKDVQLQEIKVARKRDEW